MKSARNIAAVLLPVLLLAFMSIPVWAMQAQSGPESGGAVQSNTDSAQDTSQSAPESGTEETASLLSDSAAGQESTLSSSSTISLPEVSVGSEAAGILSQGTDVTPPGTTQTWLGIVFWICIAVGIIIVVVVIAVANRKPPKGGTGRKRYERRPMTPKGKRILNEKYYRNIKK